MMEFYAAIFQGDIGETPEAVEPIQEGFLTNEAGQAYFRWELSGTLDGEELHMVFYMFEGPGEMVLIAHYFRPEGMDAEYDQLIEEAMRGLEYKN